MRHIVRRTGLRFAGLVFFSACLIGAPTVAQDVANPDACSQPASESSAFLDLGLGSRFALSSWDGCWVFVTAQNLGMQTQGFPEGRPGVAVVRRSGGTFKLVGFAPGAEFNGKPERAMGMNLTRDQKVLAVAGNRQVAFFDVAKLISGSAEPLLGTITDDRFSNVGVGMALTADDKYLFVPQGASNWLTVINLQKARAEGFNAKAIEGGIPTGAGALALLSPKGDRLYLMNRSAPPGQQSPAICERGGGEKGREGLLQVIDVERAKASAKDAVIASVPLGCNPSRLAISPDGDTLYASTGTVEARTEIREETVLAFDTRPIATGSAPRLIGNVSLGKRPTPAALGMTLVDEGRKVAVTHIVDKKSAVIAFIDTEKMAAGADALIGVIPASAHPLELAASPDGRLLLSTALEDRSLQIVDLKRLPEILRPPSELNGPPPPPAPPGHVTTFDPRRDAAKDIENAIAVAQKTGKRILLEVGGDWCSWCRVLDRLFANDPKLTELRDRHFITVKINYSPENENKAVLSRYSEIQTYPHFIVLKTDGTLLHSQEADGFETDGPEEGFDLVKLAAFFERFAGEAPGAPSGVQEQADLERVKLEPVPPRPPASAALSFDIDAPAGVGLFNFAMSPDGRKIAYVDYAPSGTLAVWVRSIDSRDARVLPGSENVFEKAATPFWSPDSRMIAYAGLDGNILKLKKISVTGGTPEVIAEIGPRNVNGNGMRRGHWFSDDLILFANDVVYRVSSKGGEVKRVTTADPAENGHTSPWLLPDGRHFLYKGSSSTVDNRAIYVASLDFSLRKRLISPAYSGGKFADGYMLFQRSGTLFAQKFDLDALALAGEAIQIADGLVYAAGPGIGSFEVSTEGTLIYRPTSANPTREQSARETTPNAIPGAIRVIRNWTSLLKK